MRGRRFRFRLGSVALLGLAVVVIGGCGAGSSSTTSASPVAKAAFLAKAKAICKDAVQTRVAELSVTAEELAAQSKPISKQEEQEKYVLEAVLPPERKMVEELLALPPPQGAEDQVGEMLEGLQQGIERIESEPSIALKPIEITPADSQIERYGLSECRV